MRGDRRAHAHHDVFRVETFALAPCAQVEVTARDTLVSESRDFTVTPIAANSWVHLRFEFVACNQRTRPDDGDKIFLRDIYLYIKSLSSRKLNSHMFPSLNNL